MRQYHCFVNATDCPLFTLHISPGIFHIIEGSRHYPPLCNGIGLGYNTHSVERYGVSHWKPIHNSHKKRGRGGARDPTPQSLSAYHLRTHDRETRAKPECCGSTVSSGGIACQSSDRSRGVHYISLEAGGTDSTRAVNGQNSGIMRLRYGPKDRSAVNGS